MTYVVALTGGIGSGKSTVADFFAKEGVPVIDADKIAHELVRPTKPAYQEIVKHWGTQVLQENKELNRPLLRQRIFTQPKDKIWLENLLHPLIHDTILEAIQALKAPYCIVVIPLLAEHYADYQAMLNAVIVIDVTNAIQHERTQHRDQADPALIERMIAAQCTSAERLKIATITLPNNGDLATLQKKVKDLHSQLLKTGISRKI
ncbi:MAG: dephospho-CoA kinase [Candidatus Berkiella sp.]